MDYQGTISRGVRAPIIKQGDDLVKIAADCVTGLASQAGFELQDRDIVAVTEAVVGRSQGNYATAEQIAKDVHEKFGDETVGLVFPILSRNRFSMILKGISMGVKKLIVQLSYPGDEVGNKLISQEELLDSGINPAKDVFTSEEFYKHFPNPIHPFTGVDYIKFYKEASECPDTEIILAKDPRAILNYTKDVIIGSTHEGPMNKRILTKAGVGKCYCMDELMTAPVNGSGCNPEFGLLGSNLATDNSVKLFPCNCQGLVDDISKRLSDKYGKKVEVMIYGDGGFKDPVGGIWEFADPVVSPFHTNGLVGTPNELKLKYLADNEYKNLNGEELKEAIEESNRIVFFTGAGMSTDSGIPDFRSADGSVNRNAEAERTYCT